MGNTRRKIVRIAIVAGLGIAMLWYSALEKHVTVRIEGRPVAVRTYAATVADALSRAGISVGPQDRVLPSPASALRDGQVVEVRRAKPITILLDGKPRRVIVTSLTIDELLEEMHLRDSVADAVFPSRSSRVRPGMTITYKRAVAVTVVHDERTEHVITNATSVRAVIRELGIKVGKRDLVRPKGSIMPVPGMRIRVLRVGLRTESRVSTVQHETVIRRSSGIEYGTRRVAQGGRDGLRRVTYRSKYVDGRRVSQRWLRSQMLRRPQPRIVLIGTGFPGCRCDRGTQSGKATWYGQADGLTAAHRTLPFGTIVRVENLANGRSVNVVIRDRGPWGDGRIIDLSDEAFSRIASLGQGVISVRIRW